MLDNKINILLLKYTHKKKYKSQKTSVIFSELLQVFCKEGLPLGSSNVLYVGWDFQERKSI